MIVTIATTLVLLFQQPAAGINCRPANSWTQNAVLHFQRIVTFGGPGYVKLRQAYNLPAVYTSPAVSLVTDEAECARAIAALDGIYTDGESHGPVYLFKIGSTRFAAADGSLTVHIFDSTYNYLVSISN